MLIGAEKSRKKTCSAIIPENSQQCSQKYVKPTNSHQVKALDYGKTSRYGLSTLTRETVANIATTHFVAKQKADNNRGKSFVRNDRVESSLEDTPVLLEHKNGLRRTKIHIFRCVASGIK